MQISNKKSSKLFLTSVAIVILLLIAAGVFFAYRYTRVTPKVSSDGPHTTRATSGSISSSRSGTDTTKTTNPEPANDTSPLKPSGTFVSNHHPNLSGSPAPNTLSSTCTTTPGALCRIEFANNDSVKSLPDKSADINGNVNWDWSLKDLGLTSGTWKITAIATIGNNIVKEPDVLDLVIAE